jgi:hypothetical protein
VSRSKRKTPLMGMTTARSEKWNKRFANRALRAAIRVALAAQREIMPEIRDVSNERCFEKDGQQWITNPKWMRK